MSGPLREALVDAAAISENVAALAAIARTPHVLVVVKADGYGHGALTAARAALDGGADWLGVADIAEGLALRNAGVRAPVLAWLHDPEQRFEQAIAAGLDLGVSTLAQLDAIAAADADLPPAVHLKVDTGLSRNGLAPDEWAEAFERAALLERAGLLRIRGLMSHLSNASADADAAAGVAFAEAMAAGESAGLDIELRHLASTAAVIRRPDARLDMVRIGIGSYGLSPFAGESSRALGLTPAMTLRTRVAAVRTIEAGSGVSYDHTWTATERTRVALVPLGYADGIPRAASSTGAVAIGGVRHPVRGRVAMDQFVVELVADAAVGDEVVVFGPGTAGEPTADDWAGWAGTINYEIVTRIGPRVARTAR